MITIDDIRDRIERPLTADEERTVHTWIRDAETVLRSHVRNLDERMQLADTAPAHLSHEAVQLVLGNMVERKLRNPSAFRRVVVDGVDQLHDASVSAGKLYLSDEDLAILAPAPVTTHQAPGAFSMQVTL